MRLNSDTLDSAVTTVPREGYASPILDQYRFAVKAQPLPGLDAIASAAAKDFGTGILTWDEYAEVNDIVQARRDRARAAPEPKPPRVHRGATPRTPESIERRRSWAADARLPEQYAKAFTMAQKGAINLILKECVEKGACRLTLGGIAGAVGTCKTVVRAAVAIGWELGLIESKQHRRSYHRSDPNTIRVVSAKLKDWLRIGAEMARRAAGLATRTKAEAAKSWMQRKADDRRALKTLRGEARMLSEQNAAQERASRQAKSARENDGHGGGSKRVRMATEMLNKLRQGGGSTFTSAAQESSLREENPSAASQPSDENCPSGSSSSGGGIFDAARLAAQRLGLDPQKFGIGPKGDKHDDLQPVLEGVSYRWT